MARSRWCVADLLLDGTPRRFADVLRAIGPETKNRQPYLEGTPDIEYQRLFPAMIIKNYISYRPRSRFSALLDKRG